MAFIILDRDGVINYESKEYIKSPDEWRPIPGSLEAIAQLNRSGFRVLVATNQSGIARGYYNLDMLSLIHEKFFHELASVGGYVDEIFFCPHHPDEDCICRKPKPGLIYRMQQRYLMDLTKTCFVGDSYIDVETAHAAGCIPILVLTGKGKTDLESYPDKLHQVLSFPNLSHAVDYTFYLREKLP